MVKISQEECTGCEQCVIICPSGAIFMKENKAYVNQDQCVECSVCIRTRICKVRAIKRMELEWPRIIRNPFSDVTAVHKLTGVGGRGTEEMKTNDVTGRFRHGEIGISIEIGRPGIGCRLNAIELFTVELAKIGVEFEKESPVTSLFSDEYGHLQEDVKNERVLSAIIEFKVENNEKLAKVLNLIKNVENKIESVFSVGIISRFEDSGHLPILDFLSEQGFNVRPNAKVNLGLGKVKGG